MCARCVCDVWCARSCVLTANKHDHEEGDHLFKCVYNNRTFNNSRVKLTAGWRLPVIRVTTVVGGFTLRKLNALGRVHRRHAVRNHRVNQRHTLDDNSVTLEHGFICKVGESGDNRVFLTGAREKWLIRDDSSRPGKQPDQ